MNDEPRRGQVLLFPQTQVPQPRAPPPPPWWRLHVPDLPANPDGLARLQEVVTASLARDWRFLRALEEHLDVDSEVARGGPLARLVDLENDAFDLLLGLRQGAVAAAEVGADLASLRAGEEERTSLRAAILGVLPPFFAEAVLDFERHHPVGAHAVRQRVLEAELEGGDGRGEAAGIEFVEGTLQMPPSFDLDAALEAAGLIGPRQVDAMMLRMERMSRAEQERRPLAAQGRLATLLRALPGEWLDTLGLRLGIPVSGLRKERERAIAAALTAPRALAELCEELGPDEIELLREILAKEGVCPSRPFRRRPGFDRDHDGWFWADQPAVSIPGRLQRRGLVFVGTWTFKKRPEEAFMVPRELRGPLAAWLATTHG
ncbi:MAG: hypothetical protein ABIO70_16710 [Pseudomonadota bacterium]